MNRFGFGISVGLTMIMLLLMRSSIADDEFKIYLLVEIRDYGTTIGPTVIVKGEDTVADLKRKIGEEIEIEPERQVLRQKSRFAPPLEDNKTVKEYDIEKFPVLFLTLDEFKIYSVLEIDDFGWSTGPTVMVNRQDTVADLKRKFAEEIKIDPKRQKLRNKIEPKRQMLRLNNRLGPTLEDSKTMKDYSIEKDQVISITFDEYEIFVHFNDKNYPIWVRKYDNVEDLSWKAKRMLKKEFKIHLDNIILKKIKYPAGNDVILCEKRQIMRKYEIEEGAIIYVCNEEAVMELVEFDIFIEYNQKKYTIRVNGGDTVRYLKTKIGNIQEIGILPNQQQKLICQKADGKVLEDEKMIAYCKIAKNSTVFITLAEIEQQEEKPRSSNNFASPQLKNRRGRKKHAKM